MRQKQLRQLCCFLGRVATRFCLDLNAQKGVSEHRHRAASEGSSHAFCVAVSVGCKTLREAARPFYWVFFACVVPGLAGCNLVKPPASDAVPLLSGDFLANGRLAIKDPEQSLSARFRWQQIGDRYVINIWSVWGQGQLTLTGNSMDMTVKRGEEVLGNGPPEVVMTRFLGWSWPVSALPLWLQGKPLAQHPFSPPLLDEADRIIEFRQFDWLLGFDRFVQRGSEALPSRIKLQRGEQSLRIIVTDYAS